MLITNHLSAENFKQTLKVTYKYIDEKHLRCEVEWTQSSGSSVYEIFEKEGVVTFTRTDYLP